MREFVKIYAAIALECLKVGTAVVLVVGVLFLLFGFQPGRGYAWPV